MLNANILKELRAIVDERGLVISPEELQTYDADALTHFRVMPRAVLLPTSTEQVQAILRVCHRERIPFVARGAGTGLSGGALPVENGVVICLARMNRILEMDFANARVVVEPGVINLDVTARVPGTTNDAFQKVAADAKANCPISRLLRAEITMKAALNN